MRIGFFRKQKKDGVAESYCQAKGYLEAWKTSSSGEASLAEDDVDVGAEVKSEGDNL